MATSNGTPVTAAADTQRQQSAEDFIPEDAIAMFYICVRAIPIEMRSSFIRSHITSLLLRLLVL